MNPLKQYKKSFLRSFCTQNPSNLFINDIFNLKTNEIHTFQFNTLSKSLSQNSFLSSNLKYNSIKHYSTGNTSPSTPIASYNPFDGSLVSEFDFMSYKAAEICISRSFEAFQAMKKFPIEKRAAAMKELAILLREQKSHFAELMATEMGKPLKQGEAEILKCADCCDYFAEHAAEMLKEKLVSSDASISKVIYQPKGPILQVAPFNFPFWQVIRFVAPALMAGNTAIIRHSHSVPKCALAIAELFEKISLPENSLQIVFLDNETVAKTISDKRIRGVAFTGSTQVGAIIASQAAANLKKHVLELGGSDPFIVLKDANLDLAIAQGISSRTLNNGQSCIAAKRFIVEEGIYEEFLARLKEKVEKLKIGNPLDPTTDVGPLARKDLRDKLAIQVESAIKEGATLVSGGSIPKNDELKKGFFYTPTILSNIGSGMNVFYEELFGPVFSVIKCRDAEHAIELANMSEYGLGGAVFSEDLKKAQHVAESIESGMAFVNGLTKSCPQLPFGGEKNSGYGRECGSEGLLEFVNVKSVWIK